MAFSFTLLTPLRIAQGVLTVLILGLDAYVAHWWSGYWHSYSPSEVNFLVFVAVWTILALVYLILAPWRFPALAHVYTILAVEALTMIFWFAGFVALAVFLGDRVCYGTVCSCAKATAVFAALQWVLFTVTTVLATLHVLRFRKGGEGPKSNAATVEVRPVV